MLSAYLNQTVEYQRKTGTDDRSNAIFAAGVTLPCLRKEKTKTVFTEMAQRVVTQHVYYLVDKVSEGDKLDSAVIASVEVWRDLLGEAVGYKAVME